MARRSTTISNREPEEYQRASEEAQLVRLNVAEQLRAGIVEADSTGSAGMVGQRVRRAVEASKLGDPLLLRVAVFEMTVAGGLWVAGIDLRSVADDDLRAVA